MTLDEYKALMKSRAGRDNKYKSAFSIRDAYKEYKRNMPDASYTLTEEEHRHILNAIFEGMADKFLKYGIVRLGGRLGAIELIKKKTKVYKRKDGTLFANYPIDWDKTLELYYNDAEAREKRIFVRKCDNDYSYRIKYRASKASLKNSCYVQFRPSGLFRSRVSKAIKENKVDGLIYEE